MPAKTPVNPEAVTARLGALGKRIREHRKMLRVSATTAAQAAGISRVTLHRIETGEASVTIGAYMNVLAALGLEFAIPLPADATSKEILIEARRDGARVLLSVRDHGQGIPEADRKHAVERFVRLEPSRTRPGSGLGLSLASAVATLHGGTLNLSDAHPGLCATLAIPGRGVEPLAVQTSDVPLKAHDPIR